ncbi:putative fasciclin-like arabinogalactan protein 20 [Gastrolobium bilobum]|uniref:putative fasciclin-like arabinogalactan protein 20 n=1 Tax=Gastrolobium bilobum TaxID=150636 RepID=UPI002AB19683|nr:putative fasciclin-like arabinogalactan protein 20 [Gastrolobium bilobum]
MASTTLVSLSLLLISLSSLSSSLPSSTILDAAEILSGSGFETMALNLELASQSLLPPRTRSITIFAPNDVAFNKIPQLPLSLLRYHLLPHAFSLHSISSLPYGANIATLLPGHSLTVTTSHSDDRVSINNVTVNPSPIFDDGYLVIFATENFFDPYFQLPAQIIPRRPNTSLTAAAACFPDKKNNRKWFFSDEAFSFKEASDVLRSRGCSVIASFLDTQFLGLLDRPQLTLFAPIDEEMKNHVGKMNLSDYSAILRHHLVPCKILWSDLVTLEDGTLIWTYERGFTINVTKSSKDMLLLNGVPVIFPELYYSDWLVVHGLREVLSVPKGKKKAVKDSDQVSDAGEDAKESCSFGFNHNGAANNAGHYHFSTFH